MQYVPLAGYLPDAPDTAPGVVTALSGYIPSPKGLRSAYGTVDAGYGALDSACLGAATVHDVGGGVRLLAGTASKLYEVVSGAWLERNNGFSTGAGRWRFAQWGNYTFATNWADDPQQSISGAFTAHTTMPKCKFIATAKNFVMLGAYNDGVDSYEDGWHCSGIGNSDAWTPSLATECANGRLTDIGGPLTAMWALGDQIAFYKVRGIWMASYQGPPTVWAFRQVSQDIGAVGQEAVVNIGAAHLFVGADDFYYFDGNVPTPIGNGVKEWFWADVDQSRLDEIVGVYDWPRSIVYWFYPSAAGTAIDKWVAYNVRTQKWGAGELEVEAALVAATPTLTYQTWTAQFATYADVPDVVYGSDYWSASQQDIAVFGSDHQMKWLNGASTTGTMTLARVGDDQAYSTLRRFTPRWLTQPTTATLTHQYTDQNGGTWTTKSAVTMTVGRFDIFQSARWHRLTLATTDDCELEGVSYDLQIRGRE